MLRCMQGFDQYNEVQAQYAFTLQNSKLLKVVLNQSQVQAKKGAMVAYQGDVKFEYQGGGIGKALKRAATGEGQTLMSVTGSGEVFLADLAQDIHLHYLQNERITINGKNLLAFENAGVQWDIQRVQGGTAGVLAGGLFNTTVWGTGWVAFVSDGPPVKLNVGQAPTFVDPQAAVAWSDGVTTSVKTDVNLKNFIGRGSGESIQLAFQGHGWVLVQPSEGQIAAAQPSGGGGGLGGLLNG